MAFVVVEFNEESGGGVSLVNRNWLTPKKQEVWWPPYKHQHLYDRALQKGDIPDDTWSLYSISRTFYETDDYMKAREKLDLSRSQSDVQSEAGGNESLPLKRKRRPRKLSFDDDTSSDEVTESSFQKSTLPRPPKRRFNVPASSLEKECFYQKKSLTNSDNKTSSANIQSPGPSQNITESVESVEKSNSCHSSYIDDSGIHVNSRSSPSVSSVTSIQSPVNDDINRKILSLMVYLKEQNSQILKLMETFQKPSFTQILELPENLPATLPLNDSEDVLKVEQFLDSKENLTALASYFSTIGGRDIASKTNTILKSLMTNTLATQYSFLGTRNGKRAFSSLKLKLVVVRAVLNICSDSDESRVCTFIKTWLKHAPQRVAKEKGNHSLY